MKNKMRLFHLVLGLVSLALTFNAEAHYRSKNSIVGWPIVIYVSSWPGTSQECGGQKCTIPVAFYIEVNIYHRVNIPKRFSGAHTYHRIADSDCYKNHCIAVGGAKEPGARYIPLTYVSDDYGHTWNLSAMQPEATPQTDTDINHLVCNSSDMICAAFHKRENSVIAKWISQDGGNTWLKVR